MANLSRGPLIAKQLDRISRQLADENYLSGLAREEFASRAADVMIDLNAIP